MTKRDYELIASVIYSRIRAARTIGSSPMRTQHEETIRFLARDLAIAMAFGNPRFDRARFLAACGVED